MASTVDPVAAETSICEASGSWTGAPGSGWTTGSFFGWGPSRDAPRRRAADLPRRVRRPGGAARLAVARASHEQRRLVRRRAAAQPDHRVCVLDFPGFGFSDKPKNDHYTLHRDCALLEYYLNEVLDAPAGRRHRPRPRRQRRADLRRKMRAQTSRRSSSHTSCSATATCSCRSRTSRTSSGSCSILTSAPQVLDALTPERLAPGWARQPSRRRGR